MRTPILQPACSIRPIFPAPIPFPSARRTTVHALSRFPCKSYRGIIYFHKVLALDATSYPGVLGVATFYSKTKFDFQTAAPDVKSFSIAKGHEFIQIDTGTPTPNISTAFVFTASVVASDAGTVNSASVITPRGMTRPLALQSDGRTFSLRD